MLKLTLTIYYRHDIICDAVLVDIAQLVRAPGCGPGGRRFESDYPPHEAEPARVLRSDSAFCFCSKHNIFVDFNYLL